MKPESLQDWESQYLQEFQKEFFAVDDDRLELQVSARSDVGCVRTRNEDHYAVIRNIRQREIISTNLSSELLGNAPSATYGLIVADGVGGGVRGDLASQIIIKTMLELSGRASSWVVRLTDMEAQEIYERVGAYSQEIQKVFRDLIRANPDLAGMGTTWTSAHVLGEDILIVQVGDSRAYHFHDGILDQVTKDQTVGQALIDQGLSENEAKRFRHVLTNSFGDTEDPVTPDVYRLHVKAGDRIVLCSDGLSDMVSNDTIQQVLTAVSDPQKACDELVEQALAAGGKDNVTVIVGRFRLATDPLRTTDHYSPDQSEKN